MNKEGGKTEVGKGIGGERGGRGVKERREEEKSNVLYHVDK